MNNNRECYAVIDRFPAKIKLRMKSTPPERRYLNPILRKLGTEECVMKGSVVDVSGKEVTVQLPMPNCPLVEGRYELCIQDKCCVDCDCIELWLEADCEISAFEVIEIEEDCDDC